MLTRRKWPVTPGAFGDPWRMLEDPPERFGELRLREMVHFFNRQWHGLLQKHLLQERLLHALL